MLVLLLPLHFRGSGVFGNAFPPDVGTRLTIGFLIRDFTLPAIVVVGLVVLWREHRLVATGIFLASGLYSILHASTAPFYALPRLQPMALLILRSVVGLLLLAAAWSPSRREPSGPGGEPPSIPPPPS
ncbi:MAG: hypothetical protein ACR2L4_02735 [Actinomycetota bacterium]